MRAGAWAALALVACSSDASGPAPSTSGSARPAASASSSNATAPPAPPSPSLRMAATSSGDGIDLYAIDSSGELSSRHASARKNDYGELFDPPEALGGSVAGVAVGDTSDGVSTLLVITRAGALNVRRRQRASWQEPIQIADGASPVVLAGAHDRGGRLVVVFSRIDGSLASVSERDDGWSAPETLAEAGSSASMLAASKDKLELVYATPAGLFRRERGVARWTAPEKLGDDHATSVALATNADGRLEVFYATTEKELRHAWQKKLGGPYEGSGDLGAATRAIGTLSDADGRIEVVFAGADGSLSRVAQTAKNEAFEKPRQLGWEVAGFAGARARDGRLHVFYEGAGGRTYHDWQLDAGDHWVGEIPIAKPGSKLVQVEPLGAPLLAPPSPDWHVNDHTFARDAAGHWRLFGIVAKNPPRSKEPHDKPAAEKRKAGFGHAGADALLGNWSWRAAPPFKEELGPGGVLWAPHVVEENANGGRVYHMFYCTGGDSNEYAISHRTSSDLTKWSEPDVAFTDGWHSRDPMVLYLADTKEWAMYYTATEAPADESHHVVALRTSSDLVHWSERKIVYRDLHTGKRFGPTESPFVVRRNGSYYLFIGPRPYDAPSDDEEGLRNWEHPGYVGTDVFKSDRYDLFTNAGFVGHLPLHAAEIVEGEGGQWYASSAGVAQGGLYLTKLTWDE